MAEAAIIDFRTSPERYKHWKLALEGGVAYLTMDVNEDGIGRASCRERVYVLV